MNFPFWLEPVFGKSRPEPKREPDFTEPLIGFKELIVARSPRSSGYIQSMRAVMSPDDFEPPYHVPIKHFGSANRAATWHEGQMEAKCTSHDGIHMKSHSAPEWGCTCGIYAWYQPRDWGDFYEAFRGRFFTVAVALSGTIIMHSSGYRAEKAQIVAVAKHSDRPLELDFSPAIVPFEELVTAAKEFGRVLTYKEMEEMDVAPIPPPPLMRPPSHRRRISTFPSLPHSPSGQAPGYTSGRGYSSGSQLNPWPSQPRMPRPGEKKYRQY